MTEEVFFNTIEKYTGRKRVDGWGLIAGTFTPYISAGFSSASNFEGFTVWKKVGEEYEELKITKYQFLPFDYLKPIIEFLKK